VKPGEAEKLLGGHATGTLTEAERRTLFAASLDHQEIFDALMDEEALRELLADPEAKAQLLAALAAPPKVVPFWRRTGLLSAVAGLILAATASLVYLRSPQPGPPALRATAKPVEATAAEVPAFVPAPTAQAKRVAPAAPAKPSTSPPPANEPAPASASPKLMAAAPAAAGELRSKEQDLYHRAEAQDKLAKKAELPWPSAALLEVAPAQKADRPKASVEAQNATVGGVLAGAVGGLDARMAAADQAERTRGDASSLPAAPAPAKSARRMEAKATAAHSPTWTLEPQPDGTTRVLVKGPVAAQAVLLRRRADHVEVMSLQAVDASGALAHWRVDVRLAAGDVLDLYLLNAPVADPAGLPETGPVDGYRMRVYPPEDKSEKK
jgi:hypothetical protein